MTENCNVVIAYQIFKTNHSIHFKLNAGIHFVSKFLEIIAFLAMLAQFQPCGGQKLTEIIFFLFVNLIDPFQLIFSKENDTFFQGVEVH